MNLFFLYITQSITFSERILNTFWAKIICSVPILFDEITVLIFFLFGFARKIIMELMPNYYYQQRIQIANFRFFPINYSESKGWVNTKYLNVLKKHLTITKYRICLRYQDESKINGVGIEYISVQKNVDDLLKCVNNDWNTKKTLFNFTIIILFLMIH